jgi:hypothetical protein
MHSTMERSMALCSLRSRCCLSSLSTVCDRHQRCLWYHHDIDSMRSHS